MGNNRTKNNFGGDNNFNYNNSKKTQPDELNAANEALKSLRLKINNGNSNSGFGQPISNLNFGGSRLNNNNNKNLEHISNDKFTKPFKPNMGDFNNNNNNGNFSDLNKNSFNNVAPLQSTRNNYANLNTNNNNSNKNANMNVKIFSNTSIYLLLFSHYLSINLPFSCFLPFFHKISKTLHKA